MIHELLGDAGEGGERSQNISINGSPTITNPRSSSTPENLKCPRCDSTNTKFCYYNNYNLTQPRHFCKTCRRYWTKGGTLRNIPIGGGCRKHKPTCITSSVVKSSGRKFKTLASEMEKSGFMISGFEHDISSSSNPFLWASPHNSHLLSLLKAANQNSNSSPAVSVKEEAVMPGLSYMNSVSAAANSRLLGLDSVGQVLPIGIGSFPRRNSDEHQPSGFVLGSEGQSTEVDGFYRRLRPSTSYYPDHAPVVEGNVVPSSPPTFTILDSSPVAAAESGYWNPVFSWPDLTTNAAYP